MDQTQCCKVGTKRLASIIVTMGFVRTIGIYNIMPRN